jgi:predicted component of type VI protein secretion system
MRARLVSLCGHPTIRLGKTLTLVGRQPCCDVRILSSRISRRHCCLAVEGAALIVRDLDSTNGIRVNGRPVESGPLRHGDVLTIGHLDYRVCLAGPDDGPPSEPADPSRGAAAEEPPTSMEIPVRGPGGPSPGGGGGSPGDVP